MATAWMDDEHGMREGNQRYQSEEQSTAWEGKMQGEGRWM
jgi:hypothetical protein